MNKRDSFLHFQVQGMRYALPLERVERVLPIMAARAVPNAPDYLVGVIDVAGESVLLVDLGMRLGLPIPAPYSIDTPVLLCPTQRGRVACVVEAVDGIFEAEVPQMGKQFSDSGLPYSGIIAGPSGLALLLDADNLLDIELSEALAPKFIQAEALARLV